jgi:hypothetical protein
MAFITPGTLQVSPAAPTEGDILTFKFHAELDWQDTLPLFGFSTTFFILARKQGEVTWKEAGSWRCNNCFNTFGSEDRHALVTIPVDNMPIGTYEFLAIDYGIYMGKLPPYDSTKTATTRVTIKEYVDLTIPHMTIRVTQPDATISVDGVKRGTGSASINGIENQEVNIEVKLLGYLIYRTTQKFAAGTVAVPQITLVPCSAGTPNCYATPIDLPVDESDGECEGMNRGGGFDISCITDPQNTMYLYGAIGLVVVILLMGGKKK